VPRGAGGGLCGAHEVLRVGVVGGGAMSQLVHLPQLDLLRDRFAIAALAEPSAAVREELARRYAIPRAHADHRELLAAGGLDALLVCSPNATHAAAVTDALRAGLHVLVEKPLCISPADADEIVRLRDAAGTVVQVGYAKRHDPAFEALRDALPDSIERLRHVNVLTYEPDLARWFRPAAAAAGDVPQAAREALARATEAQVAAAVGAQAPEAAFVFAEIYLGSLIHDVNLVHGLLERMGEPPPRDVRDSARWQGPSASASIALSNGVRWNLAWTQATTLHDFREQIVLVFEDAVHTLTFPAPYLPHGCATWERSGGPATRREGRAVSSWRDRHALQLERFHASVTRGEPTRTPPEQARADMRLLVQLFAAAGY
jgi:predicted dehydrogenase